MIENEYGKNHIPMKFTWEMTEKCNLNCKWWRTIDERGFLSIVTANNQSFLYMAFHKWNVD